MKLPPLFTLCLSVVIVSFTGCGGGYSAPASPPPTTPPPASETVDFAVSGTYSSPGIKPVNAVTADFNGDGKPDVAVSDRVSGTVAVYFNNGDGTLKDPILTTVPDSTGLAALTAGDFNEEGKPDLLVGVNFGMDRTFVMIGKGDGTFQQMPSFFNASFIRTITADINGDHHLDLAVGVMDLFAYGRDGAMALLLMKGFNLLLVRTSESRLLTSMVTANLISRPWTPGSI